jgi:hypothetical protein
MAQTLKFGNGTWATKKGSILAYNDQNENYKPLPFNYTGVGKGTRVNKEGLIEVVENDRPRIDYLDSEDGVFLLENAATNLITYSEDFSNGSWVESGASVTSGFLSPDGTNNAFKLIESNVNARHTIHSNTTTNPNNNHTLSAFVKKGEKKYVTISALHNNTNGVAAQFDLEKGIVVFKGDLGSIYTYINSSVIQLKNGWYKISLTLRSTLTTISASIGLANSIITSASVYVNGSVYNGDGISGIYIFGAMLEQSSQSSSYIPTQGTIQTRVAEAASGSGNSEVFNDSEGVLFADIAALADDGNFRVIAINGTPTNVNEDRIQIYFRDTANIINFGMESGNSSQFFSQFPLDVKLNNKLALKYSASSCSFWINGFEVGEELNKVMPTGLSRLDFNIQNGNDDFYGKTKEIAYYDEVLTEEELETLTSYRSWLSMVKELNLNVIYNG